MKSVLLRLYRAGVLALIAWLVHDQHRWMKAQSGDALTVEQVKDVFPHASKLGPRDPDTGLQPVLDEKSGTLGLVTQTAPFSNKIIGYSGPTNTLIICDAQGLVMGLRVLHSEDTEEHLKEVLRQREFFDSFKGIKMGDAEARPRVAAVSGATLTSTAIAEGVLRRIGGRGASLRFPEDITLAEVRQIVPQAMGLAPSRKRAGVLEVTSSARQVIALACRTSPYGDGIIGHQGPSDTLLVLDADGSKVIGFRLRKSYDTKDYVGYVTGDGTFAHAFDGMEVKKLAGLDFNTAKIEGVSGATETSWAVAEGLKRRAAALLEPPPKNQSRWNGDNIGLALMIAWSCIVAFTPLRGRAWVRTLHQVLLIGYAGFYLGGMISQGMLVGWARNGVPWTSAPALVLLAAAAFALPLFTRHQLYCHHFCPHGALQQLVAHRLKWQLHVPAWLSRVLEKMPLALLVVVLATAMLGWRINLNALEPFDAYLFRIAGWGAITIAATGFVASLFVPMAYCRYGCPTGALLKFVRYQGHADHFGKRDVVALILVVMAAVLFWKKEMLMSMPG